VLILLIFPEMLMTVSLSNVKDNRTSLSILQHLHQINERQRGRSLKMNLGQMVGALISHLSTVMMPHF